jgi:hypothetical protein
MLHSTVIAFCFGGVQSLLVGGKVCQNNVCHQCSLLCFSLIHIYYRIYFLVIPVLSHWTRYSWSYSYLIFFSRGYDGPKVCDAESLFLLLFLLYFSLFHVLHSIWSLILPILCHGSMYFLSYGYLNFFDGKVWRKKVCDPESLLLLLFLLYFSLFRLFHYIRSLTIPLLWHASRYCWSYSYLREFSMESSCNEAMLTSTCFFLWSSYRGIPHKLSIVSSFYLVYILLLFNPIVIINLDKLD